MPASRRAVLPFVLALVVVLPAVAPASAADTEGSDFWLAIPRSYNQEYEDYVKSVTITGQTPSSGVVEMPGLGFSQGFTLTAAQPRATVVLPYATYSIADDGVEERGIHVTADGAVSVYGHDVLQEGGSADAFTAMPTDALGVAYRVLGWPTRGFGPDEEFLDGAASQLTIVGTQAGTTVTVVPFTDVGTRPAGLPFQIVLGQGQTYQLRADQAGEDLTGTQVEATAPVAVISSHSCANVPVSANFCDYMVEQLPPVSSWGTSFGLIDLASRTAADPIRVLATNPSTTVSVNGTPVATLAAGAFHQMTIDGPTHVTATAPILVAQFANGRDLGEDGDPLMMLVPPSDQYLDHYVVETLYIGGDLGHDIHFINVVAPDAILGQVTLDGAAIPTGSFTPIADSGLSAAQRPVPRGTHRLDGPAGFGVWMYGFGRSAVGYGYPGGFGSLAPTPVLCAGQAATIVGTAGDDILSGTNGHDVIHGLGGNDQIDGLNGDDIICGGDGNDTLRGDRGRDTLDGGTGDDLLLGQQHPDWLIGGDGDDRMVGGDGADKMVGDAGDDRLDGGGGNDTIRGEAGDDTLTGGDGDDRLFGGPGIDSCTGNAGNDTLASSCETAVP